MRPSSLSSSSPVCIAPKPHSPTSPAARIVTGPGGGGTLPPPPPPPPGGDGADGAPAPQFPRNSAEIRAAASAGNRRVGICEAGRGTSHYAIGRVYKSAQPDSLQDRPKSGIGPQAV